MLCFRVPAWYYPKYFEIFQLISSFEITLVIDKKAKKS